MLRVNTSLKGQSRTLRQVDNKGKRRVSRFESRVQNYTKQYYNAIKREYRGVLKCLQKLQFQLYSVYFILEINVNTLVVQLNRVATDLLGVLVTRQLAWIRLFDFEVQHIKGIKHIAADRLSRRPQQEDDSEDKLDINDFIIIELNIVGISIVD